MGIPRATSNRFILCFRLLFSISFYLSVIVSSPFSLAVFWGLHYFDQHVNDDDDGDDADDDADDGDGDDDVDDDVADDVKELASLEQKLDCKHVGGVLESEASSTPGPSRCGCFMNVRS